MMAGPCTFPGNSGLTIYSDVLGRPPKPELKLEHHSNFLYRGREDTNMNTVSTVENGKILERIFSYLPMQDLLSCRRVCFRWDAMICSPMHTPSILWSKTRLGVKKRPAQKKLTPFTFVDATSNTGSHEWHLWQAVHSTPLICVYKCPNLHIQGMDLRRPAARDFLIVYGNQIQCLEITKCDLSLVTFQKIMAYCPHLVFLKIKPVPYHSLIYGESLSPEARPPIIWLKSLKTLALYSDYKKHAKAISPNGNWTEFRDSCKRKVNLGDHQSHQFTDSIHSLDYIENHLHPSLIAEIICAAPQLCEVILYGWTGDTVASMLKSLAIRQPHRPLKKLEFHDILLMFDSEEVETSLTALSTSCWCLESFALSFQSPLSSYDMQTSRLNSIVRQVLLMSSKTLISINLKNCSSVDETIFEPVFSNVKKDLVENDSLWNLSFPKLEALELAGTNVKCLSAYVKFMPKLKMVNFQPGKHQDEDDDDHHSDNDSECSAYDVNTKTSTSKKWLQLTAAAFHLLAAFHLVATYTAEKLPHIGYKVGAFTGTVFIALMLTCIFYPFFLGNWDHSYAFIYIVLLSSMAYFAFLVNKTLPPESIEEEADDSQPDAEELMAADADPTEKNEAPRDLTPE